ncbi:GntR family transcriptional regulator [Devosia yakushimensis]|uniref:GntR family transcriptional regulator n=1 Tax=Devosia yakushimensis TaxID=470028 RepID=A0ABQ5U9T6_9HYPH|nr:GntR family transcriptional regulator [Devosia yakushimensis]
MSLSGRNDGKRDNVDISSLLAGYHDNLAHMTRNEAIVSAIDRAIDSGTLGQGARLPTVRALSEALDVSPSTVVAAYSQLRLRGRISGTVGRGTYVSASAALQSDGGQEAEQSAWASVSPQARPPWRRRTVLTSANRLQTMYPDALDCSRGKPDTSLILTELVRRAQQAAAVDTDAEGLQYAGPVAIPSLSELLAPRLVADNIPVSNASMVAGTSAQQLMVMSLSIAARLMPDRRHLVAVEEPGYQTVFDAFEYMGFRLVGMRLDEHGVIPESLDEALAAGAIAALFTPRAQNPAGVSWTPERRAALAEVLKKHPHAIAIEDDQFADIALTRPGSLLEGPAAHRTVYIRTFAKSIAPDLRTAVAVVRPRLAAMLGEAKSLMDGWTSLHSQNTLVHVLEDTELEQALSQSRESYRARRDTIMAVLSARLAGTGTRLSGTDGLNIWIRLPFGVAATDVVDNAASAGVLLVSGEPFYIRPGHNDVIRMSISGIADHEAERAASLVADAILAGNERQPISIPL